MKFRQRLQAAASDISASRGDKPYSRFVAARKLLLSERRNRSLPGRPVVGWKRGELFELLVPLVRRDWPALAAEWGDCGYYLSQSYGWLWWLYEAITPNWIIEDACRKFERRAKNNWLRVRKEDEK